jgi:hypothetical protein
MSTTADKDTIEVVNNPEEINVTGQGQYLAEGGGLQSTRSAAHFAGGGQNPSQVLPRRPRPHDDLVRQQWCDQQKDWQDHATAGAKVAALEPIHKRQNCHQTLVNRGLCAAALRSHRSAEPQICGATDLQSHRSAEPQI